MDETAVNDNDDKIAQSLDVLVNELDKRALGISVGSKANFSNSSANSALVTLFGAEGEQRAAKIGALVESLDTLYRFLYDTSGVVLPAYQFDWRPEELHDLKQVFIGTVLFHTGVIGQNEVRKTVPAQLHRYLPQQPIVNYLVAERGRDITAVLAAIRKVQDSVVEKTVRAAFVDGLTGLYNRRFFDQRLPVEITRASRHRNMLGLVYVDLDGLKTLNDRHGHNVGDEMLKALGKSLIHHTRAEDTAYRFGGDEFAITLPHMDVESLRKCGERTRTKIEDDLRTAYQQLNLSEEYSPSVSIGGAVFNAHAHDAAGLILAADMATYLAKLASKKDQIEATRIEQLLRVHKQDASVLLPGFKIYDPSLNGAETSFYAAVQALLGERKR